MSELRADIIVLLCTRMVRMFAYGSLSVILALYLTAIGLTGPQIGLLLALTLVGDTIISLWLTTRADRFGRRRTLIVGSLLMVLAGVVFVMTDSFVLLLLAATIGVISPSGYEVGPFLSVEQAALSQVVSDRNRTNVFAWYTLAASLATAFGSLVGGVLVGTLQWASVTPVSSYRVGVGTYALLGILLGLLFTRLTPAAEVPPAARAAIHKAAAHRLGLPHSQRIVLRLSSLFALDAFGGGFIIQTLTAYWLHVRFGVQESALGGIFFGANILAGLSALVAARMAARFGLINTMVFTHLPSNVLLMLVPLMPNLTSAVVLLFVRFSISQMDVPTRQSYVMSVVPPEERSAAAGVTGVARTVGASIAPIFAGWLIASPSRIDALFYLGGGIKVVYDLLLYRSFITVRPPEECSPPQPPASQAGEQAVADRQSEASRK